MLALIIFSLAAALSGLLVFIYYQRKGQFEESEGVKYQLFRNETERGE